MIRIYLEKIVQKNKQFFIGKVDPRILVQLADKIEVGATQDAQRPLEKKHLEEIAKYVGEKEGTLPQSILISTKENQGRRSLKIESEEVSITNSDGTSSEIIRYFVLIPNTEEEIAEHQGTIDIIDGQHRLISFREDFISLDLKDDDPYEISFSLFDKPTTKERRTLFMVTNEKQKAVNKNFLLWLRKQLDLLEDSEKRFFDLVNLLNSEEKSPLKKRIILSAEKIPKGYKAKEIIKILNKTFPQNNVTINQKLDTDEKKLEALSRYLKAWEQCYDVSFQNPDKKKTITKISGLRYILWWFPTFFESSIESRTPFNENFIRGVIEDIKSNEDIGNIFSNSTIFRGEGATDKAVKDHIEFWKAHRNDSAQEDFDPLDVH